MKAPVKTTTTPKKTPVPVKKTPAPPLTSEEITAAADTEVPPAPVKKAPAKAPVKKAPAKAPANKTPVVEVPVKETDVVGEEDDQAQADADAAAAACENSGVTMEHLVLCGEELTTLMGLTPPLLEEGLTEDLIIERIKAASPMLTPQDVLTDECVWVLNTLGAVIGIPAPTKKAKPVKTDKKSNSGGGGKTSNPTYTRKHALAEAILAGCANREELAAKSDELFGANTGKPANLREAFAVASIALPVLELLGVTIYRA